MTVINVVDASAVAFRRISRLPQIYKLVSLHLMTLTILDPYCRMTLSENSSVIKIYYYEDHVTV